MSLRKRWTQKSLSSFWTRTLRISQPAALLLETGVGQGLGEHDVDNLLAKEELAALLIVDDICNRPGGCGTQLRLGAA